MQQWRELDEDIGWCDERIARHASDNPRVRRATTLLGVGPVGASAAVATVGDFHQFRNGAQFARWIGSRPASSSGGKSRLGGITKHGDTYLRTLLIQGAKSAILRSKPRDERVWLWAAARRASGLAEGGRGAGQQERAHPVGDDHPRRRLRSQPPEPQTRLRSNNPSSSTTATTKID